MSDDEQAIRDVVATWMRATREGDLETLLDLMTDDVVFLTPGQEPFGKETFASLSRQGVEAGAEIDGAAEVLEVAVFGKDAMLHNRLEVTMTAPDAPPMRRAGHTLSILHKGQDGKWRIARDANLLRPVEPPAA